MRYDGLNDRVIPRPRGVDGAQAPILPGRDAPPRGALQNQTDLVIRQHSGQQLFMQPAGCPRAITPPTVRATTNDVRTVDNQDLHSDSVGEFANVARAECMLKAGFIRPLADRWTRYIWTKPPLVGGLLATTSRKPMRLRPRVIGENTEPARDLTSAARSPAVRRCRLQHAFLGSWPGVKLSLEECSYAGTPPGINHVQRTAS